MFQLLIEHDKPGNSLHWCSRAGVEISENPRSALDKGQGLLCCVVYDNYSRFSIVPLAVSGWPCQLVKWVGREMEIENWKMRWGNLFHSHLILIRTRIRIGCCSLFRGSSREIVGMKWNGAGSWADFRRWYAHDGCCGSNRRFLLYKVIVGSYCCSPSSSSRGGSRKWLTCIHFVKLTWRSVEKRERPRELFDIFGFSISKGEVRRLEMTRVRVEGY